MDGTIAGPVGNQAAYAKHCGVSRQAISKLVKTGKIPVEDDGKINFARADMARAQNMDPSRSLAAKMSGSPTTDIPHADGDDDSDLFDQVDASPVQTRPTGESSYQSSRAKREGYNAELARLQLEQQQSLLIDRREVEDAMVTAGRSIRQGLDGIASWSDEIDAAARNGGVNAVRSLLKEKVRGLEELIAASLTALVDDDNGDSE